MEISDFPGLRGCGFFIRTEEHRSKGEIRPGYSIKLVYTYGYNSLLFYWQTVTQKQTTMNTEETEKNFIRSK